MWGQFQTLRGDWKWRHLWKGSPWAPLITGHEFWAGHGGIAGLVAFLEHNRAPCIHKGCRWGVPCLPPVLLGEEQTLVPSPAGSWLFCCCAPLNRREGANQTVLLPKANDIDHTQVSGLGKHLLCWGLGLSTNLGRNLLLQLALGKVSWELLAVVEPRNAFKTAPGHHWVHKVSWGWGWKKERSAPGISFLKGERWLSGVTPTCFMAQLPKT